MGMQLTIGNILYFFASVAPLFLAFLLVMISVFNQNVKGLVYLGGVLIASLINLLVMHLLKSPSSPDKSPTCDLIEFPFNLNQYNSPALNSMFIAFTIAYLVIPMHYNDQMNYALLGILLSLFFLDSFTKIRNKCTNFAGATLGALIGLVLGALYFTLFHATGNDSLLFFNEFVSNNTICSRPKKQTFKCAVYKNGQLIQNI